MNFIQQYYWLTRIRIAAQLTYKKSFIIELFGYFLQMMIHIVGILVVFYHVEEFADWNMWEVLYLYGLTSLAFVVAQLFSEGFEDLADYIRTGEFDKILLCPVSPMVQIASHSFRFERLGGVLQAGVALVISGIKTGAVLEHPWLLIVSLFSLVIIYCGLFLAHGAFCFWTIESTEVFNAFTYGGIEVSKYPLAIYDKWMQQLFVFIIPLGLSSYLPTIRIFDKPNMAKVYIPELWTVPIISIVFWLIIKQVWNFSIKHYQSTGS